MRPVARPSAATVIFPPCNWTALLAVLLLLAALPGCKTLKLSYQPPSVAHQPQTSLDPQIKDRLREAAKGSEDQLALAAITLAGEKVAAPADIAAYAAELQPASAQFLEQSMSDMFPEEAARIAEAVAAAIPSSEATVAPSHPTGHTFFYWR
jgi:hypothetical protein